MKKKIFYFSFIFIFLIQADLFAKSTKFYWSKVSYTKSSSFYIDKSSIKKVGPYLYFWALTNYDIPDKSGTKSVISVNRVECNSMKSQILSYTSYFDFFGEGRLKMDFILSNPKWESYGDRSAHYLTLKTVCRN